VSAPTPLLDFFKRGEVARDVRMLAAAGALAPRAHEQLAILILLLDDGDPEVRGVASQTLDRIPVESLRAFLGRSDVPIGIREFFADRGVFPSEIPRLTADDPLIDTDPEPAPDEDELDDAGRATLIQRIARMNFTEKLKAATKGSREMRAILIRDTNKMIAASVLSSAKISESEIEAFARMANVSEEVLRVIGMTRAWVKNYGVVVSLTRNPKTPLGLSLNLLARLNDRDVATLSIDRNIPEPLRAAARRKVVFGQKG